MCLWMFIFIILISEIKSNANMMKEPIITGMH